METNYLTKFFEGLGNSAFGQSGVVGNGSYVPTIEFDLTPEKEINNPISVNFTNLFRGLKFGFRFS